MLSFEAFKFAIGLLEKHGICYYVFGGLALDGLRGSWTRDHGDLDIYIVEQDLERFCDVMGSAGYPCTKRESMYFIDKDPLKMGIVILSQDEAHYISKGNKTLAYYPKPVFSEVGYGRIRDVAFRVAPNEVLAFEAQHSRFPEDKEFGMRLPCDPVLFGQIRSTVLRASRHQ